MLNTKTFNQLFDFTRSGNASYWDANGVLQQAGTNTPRFDYDPVTKKARGLLIEEQRTNLCYQSAALATSPWSLVGTGIVAGIYTATGPDGSMVDSLTGSSTYASRTQQTTTVAASTTYVLSGFFRTVDAAATKFHASLPNSLIAGSQVVMNWSGSTLTSLILNAPATGGFQAVGGGWYRVWCAFTTNASDVGVATIRVYPSNSEGTALSVFAWGIQLEAGSFPTSYIPTTAGTVQRNPEVCKLQTTLMPVSTNTRTNLLTYSEQFDNAAWSKGNTGVTVGLNTTTSPDGNLFADALLEGSTASQFHFIQQGLTKAAASLAYTFSFYIKNLGGREVAASLANGSNGVAARFSPASGTIIQTVAPYGTGFSASPATITSVGSGWYRCTIGCVTDASTALTAQLSLYSTVAASNVYTGDGTSGVYMWGAMVETGTTATPYISTITAARTVTDLLPFSVLMEFEANNTVAGLSGNPLLWGMSGTDGFWTSTYLTVPSGVASFLSNLNGGIGAPLSGSLTSALPLGVNRFAVAAGPAKITALLNRNGPRSVQQMIGPASAVMTLGSSPWNPGNYLNGWIRDFEIMPRELSEAELQNYALAL
jgi:hypothetical protein